jgi:hypothetical protein
MDSMPKLTIVAAARNDDHGGNLLRRMQVFINGLLEQCRRHQLSAELVLVEWNPPPDRPRLAEALSWPTGAGPCSVRIIEVSPEIHRRFKHSNQLPLFQMIAKNVGIRRARGRFVLATNIDILFSNELMHFLASGRLKMGYMYRVDRYDVPADVPVDASIEKQLTYCGRNLLRIHKRDATISLTTGHNHLVYPPMTWQRRLREFILPWIWPKSLKRTRLHTNACGDFTLMARGHWLALRGYPEFEMYSLHLDSLLCHAAHHSGAQEQVLLDPMRIYHIEHATGSGWTPEGQKKLDARLDAAGIPQLGHDQFDAWAIQMRREGRPIIFNSEGWGLADELLHKTTICGAVSLR